MKAKSIKGKSPEEIEYALQSLMADGFQPTGELGRATGGNLEMHNHTTCVVVLKEK